MDSSYESPRNKDSSESSMPLLDGDAPMYARKHEMSRNYLHYVLHLVSLTAIIGLSIAVQRSLQTSHIKCWNKFNYYSPVNEAVAPNAYVRKEFNGSLWYDSPFKGPPTPEVDKAWYDIMKFGMISASKEDIEKVGHPDWSAQFPESVGGGYIAATIGSHQLHCLKYIFEDYYLDYYPKASEKKSRVPELYERHWNHCMDYIRQSLMCQFDTGIIPYNWVLDHQNPTPNANTHHTCVNWDRLQDWLEERVVEMPEGFQWSQPEDAVSLGWNP